ncbi:MAG: adenylate/guanylate cyclase domain-containing protein, partial [Treponema sp.]|nr:adenylate/guanylate cyclase domain-containing protein [Treponema sp.]
MRKLGTKNKKKNAALVIILAVFTVIGLLHFIGAFQYLENMSYDLRVRQFAAPTPASDEIIVILLDQDSLDWAQEERGWGWPWPRQAYAEMLDFMNLGEANSFAFDVIYSEPSIYRNSKQDVIVDAAMNDLKTAVTAITEDRLTEDRFTEKDAETAVPLINNVIDSLHELNNQEDDASFVRAQTEYGRAIQGVLFSTRSGSAYSWPDGLETPVFEADKESFGDFLQQFGLGANETTLDKAVFPIKELRESAGALGSITGIPDSDGVIRRLRLFTFFDNKAVPALGAASLLVSGSSPNITFNPKTSSIQWDDFSIPVDKNGTSLLRYRGRLDNYYPYSIKEILLSAEAVKKGEESFLYPEDFTGRFVFFGFYAEGLYDIFSTPISSVYPGMGVHITMLDNILMGDFIRESEEWLNIIILFFAVSITILLCIFTSRIYISVGGMLIAVAGVVFAAFAAYNTGSLWLPMVVHIAGIITAFISATIYNFVTEGSQKRFIKSAFSQYLSPKVIDRIIADPSQLKLGGEKREMTAIFTDVRSFSTISEALGDPQKLVELLNHYLTRMSNIVLENQGTIDKYEGDAIIAFFGAPVHMENHAS